MRNIWRIPPGLALYIEKFKLFTPNASIVLAYSGITGLAFGVFRLLFNFYVLSLGGYDERFLGFLTSVSSLASLAIALPAAYIADRYSHKGIMIVTGVISAASFLGLVLLPYRFFLVLFNVIMGLAMSVRQVATAPFLMNNTSAEERQYVFSFNFGLNTMAGFVGNWIGGMLPTWFSGLVAVLPTDTLAYQLALGSMVLISTLAVGPLFRIRERHASASGGTEMPWVQVWRYGRALLRYVTPQFIIGLGAGLMMPFMNLYYRNIFDRSDAAIGTLFALGSLTMAIAQFLGPPLADRIGKINTTLLTQGLSVPFMLLLALAAWVVPGGTPHMELWYLIAAVAYLFRLALMNFSNPIYQTFVLENVQPELQALSASLTSIAFQFGWAFSPYLSGWFQATYGDFGFVPVILSTSVLYIIAIIVTWAFFRDAEKKADAAGQGLHPAVGD
ncbi:MAG: MFS transporter [Anaerolineae bacterium]